MKLFVILAIAVLAVITSGCAKPHSQLYTVMEDLHYKSKLYREFIKKCAYDNGTAKSQFPDISYDNYEMQVEKCASKLMKGKECDRGERSYLKKATDCDKAEEQIRENKILLNRAAVLQASLSYKFDTRDRGFIEKDDNINIIVEKVHIGTNEDIFLYGEVAVVVSVIDGNETQNDNVSGEGRQNSKDVIVYFSKRVPKSFDLPFSSLLAYSGEYRNKPIVVKIMVIDIDEYMFDRYNEILDMAAKMGETLFPAYAGATSLAASIGKLVLETSSENDVIAEFSFPLYPKSEGEGQDRKYYIESPGITIASTGRYLILATSDEQSNYSESNKAASDLKDKIYQQESYYLDSNSNLYLIDPDKLKEIFKDPYDSALEDKAIHIAKKEREIEKYRIDKDISYAILSIDKRKLEGTDLIIRGLNSMYRELKDKQIISDSEQIKNILVTIESNINLFKMINEYEKEYSSKWAFMQLMKKYNELKLNKEKEYLMRYVQGKIDFDQKQIFKDIAQTDNMADIIKYLSDKGEKIYFNKDIGKFSLKEE